ncbi:tigger transposable element-derived 1-like [Pelobates cultripes]|uniref:Tigger transposable element-derived 1-like n=1 Tax=Pelobates cultripes TaxID=61616 RepID=A0AAD1R6Q7_PELCU|nr:tigger transposable element-derived 1-like [Pelobates cultripes]
MKEKITGRGVAKRVTRVFKQWPPVLEEVEKLLLLWIEENHRAGYTVTEEIICKKAKALHADLLDQRAEIVVRHGEAVSSDVAAAEFLEVMVSECYLPQRVFNCNETGLFWKRMPKCTFVMEEETSLPDHKLMKDLLILLFCANAMLLMDNAPVHTTGLEEDLLEDFNLISHVPST